MIYLDKSPDRPFRILNLTDMQMTVGMLAENSPERHSFEHTFRTLMERVKPDLITISGDLTDRPHGDVEFGPGNEPVITYFSRIFEEYRVPWAPVSGNHDYFETAAPYFDRDPLCLFEAGDPSHGIGNYVIVIRENDRLVHAVIMMDTHRCNLYPEQVVWYKEQIRALTEMGCTDTSLIFHIPLRSYLYARDASLAQSIDPSSVSITDSYKADVWNPDHADSFGVWHEGICCPGTDDDGMFAAVKTLGSTKHIIAGHDHVNNAVVTYEGIRLIYALKTAHTTYYEEELNGGTVLTVTSEGMTDVHHEYVK